jgi:hypothetical protein
LSARHTSLSVNTFFAKADHDPAMSKPGNVIIEFHHVGAFVKVSAIDTETYTEVSIVGDPTRSDDALKRAAIRRLEYVMERNQKAAKQARGSLA